MESVVSSSIACQFSWMVAMNDLPLSEKGLLMGRMFVSACGIRSYSKLLRVLIRDFLCS